MMASDRRPTLPYTELDSRRSSYLDQISIVSRRSRLHLYIIVRSSVVLSPPRPLPRSSRILYLAQAGVAVTTLFVAFHSTPDATKEQIQTLSRASLQRFQEAAKHAVGGSSPLPNALACVNSDGGGGSSYQYPKILHTPQGYSALSRKDNPWRERFLVPLYACNEQETGSQMHVRQLLHLAKALNRTLVLPNWGFGVRFSVSSLPSLACFRKWETLTSAADANLRTRTSRYPPSAIVGRTRSTLSTRPSRRIALACGPSHTGSGWTISLASSGGSR